MDDTIIGNCSTTNSLPSPVLNWFINGDIISSIIPNINHDVTIRTVNTPKTNGLVDSYSEIVLRQIHQYCRQGRKVKLKCVAILGEIFLKTNEVSLEINGCIDNTRVSDAVGDNLDKEDKMVFSNQMKSNIPFDFVISRSTSFSYITSQIFVYVLMYLCKIILNQ